MKVVLSTKDGNSYMKKVEDASAFLGKKVGEEVELSAIGADGYKAKIAGGSDKDGFPIKSDLGGTGRKRVYIFTDRKKGLRERITRRGNIIAADINQLNLVVTHSGSKSLAELFPKESKGEDKKVSIKEEMIQKSLEMVGKISAEEAKEAKKAAKKAAEAKG